MIGLRVTDIRYARQDLYIDSTTDGTAPRDDLRTSSRPRLSKGKCLPPTSGSPIPNAVVSATTRVHNQHANGMFSAKFRADVHGRFVINPIAGESITLGAFPTGAEPYLIQQDELKWPKGTVRLTHDIKVRRGVLVRGKVTEQGTNRPLAASSIQFIPVRGGDTVLSGWQAIVASQDDGSFQIAAPAGKGHLLVFGPTGDYVLDEIGFNRLYDDKPGGIRYYSPRDHSLRCEAWRFAARGRRGTTAWCDHQRSRPRPRWPDDHRWLRHHNTADRGVQPALARRLPDPHPRRPIRATRAGPRGIHAYSRSRS